MLGPFYCDQTNTKIFQKSLEKYQPANDQQLKVSLNSNNIGIANLIQKNYPKKLSTNKPCEKY